MNISPPTTVSFRYLFLSWWLTPFSLKYKIFYLFWEDSFLKGYLEPCLLQSLRSDTLLNRFYSNKKFFKKPLLSFNKRKTSSSGKIIVKSFVMVKVIKWLHFWRSCIFKVHLTFCFTLIKTLWVFFKMSGNNVQGLLVLFTN